MTRLFMFIHLVFLCLTHGLFLRITTPSQMIQPLLHGVFVTAAIASLLFPQMLLNQDIWRERHLAVRLISLAIFGMIWSFGIVAATQYSSARLAATSGAEAVLFYGTSGTQFFSYQDALLCWVLFLPIALIYLISSIVWPKKPTL